MRRLRRAHEKSVKERISRRGRIRRQAVAAGTAAVVALGAGAAIRKAHGAYTPDPHQLQVAYDADSDLLADKEESSVGYRIFEADQNRTGIPDGIELAKRCAAVINELPRTLGHEPGPDEIYRVCIDLDGLEQCDVCGQEIHMGGCIIVNPSLGLQYPTKNDPLENEFLPDLAVHYMEHGSFDCFGSFHAGRVDLQRLMRVLELRFPYEPNDHQLPLDYVVEPAGQLAPDANDLDGDLLADSEELAAGYDLHDADQDGDLTPDGVELATQCARAIEGLPEHKSGQPPSETYKVSYFQKGLEQCEICGEWVNMGYWQIVNPKLGLSVDVYDITCHYMGHGSLSYSGQQIDESHEPFHTGRVDISLLLKMLEMPRDCADLGTMYLPGDLNRDCRVDARDFSEFADKWLDNTEPGGGQ